MGLFDVDFQKDLEKQNRDMQKNLSNQQKVMRKSTKVYVTRAGDRTLTPAQKRKEKEKRGFKCDICHKKFNPRILEIHHKKGVAKSKTMTNLISPTYSFGGKKYIPKYDRHKSNLQVVCVYCHDKTKKHKKKKIKPIWEQYG